MLKRRVGSWGLLWAVALTLGLGSADAHGQKTQPEITIVRLKFMVASDAAKMLSEIFEKSERIKIVPDPSANQLLLSAPADEMKKITAILERLDADRRGAGKKVATQTYQLKHAKLDDRIVDILTTVLGKDEGVRVAADARTNAIIISGDEMTHRRVNDLIRTLDVPLEKEIDKSSLLVRVVWLRELENQKVVKVLPKDLQPVEAQLKKMGIEKLGIAGQVLINAETSDQFEVVGQAAVGENKNATWAVAGMVKAHGKSYRLEMTIQAGEQVRGGRGGFPRSSSRSLCDLTTKITAPLNHVVLLGATPTQGSTSVFVVQLLKPTPAK